MQFTLMSYVSIKKSLYLILDVCMCVCVYLCRGEYTVNAGNCPRVDNSLPVNENPCEATMEFNEVCDSVGNRYANPSQALCA